MSDPVTQAIDQQVNSKRIEEVDDCLTPTDQLLMSTAISLKRIADALWGTEGTSGLLQLLNPLDVRNNY
jgi:hypothetical protein